MTDRTEFIVTIIAIILISIVGGIITTYAWDSGQVYSEPIIPTETTTSWNATVQPFFDENDIGNYTIEPYSPIIYGGGGVGINESTTNEAYLYAVGGGGGGGAPEGYVDLFNQTACDVNSIAWGNDCDCFSCGVWYGTVFGSGFWNKTGFYYDDGTPTGMTATAMEEIESTQANYRYEDYMNQNGHYRINGKWT